MARVAAFASVSLALSALTGRVALPCPVRSPWPWRQSRFCCGSTTELARAAARWGRNPRRPQRGPNWAAHPLSQPPCPRVLVRSARPLRFGSGASRCSSLTSLPASLGEHGAAGGHGKSTLAEGAGCHRASAVRADADLAHRRGGGPRPFESRGEAALWRLAQRMRLLWCTPAPVAWASRQVVAHRPHAVSWPRSARFAPVAHPCWRRRSADRPNSPGGVVDALLPPAALPAGLIAVANRFGLPY